MADKKKSSKSTPKAALLADSQGTTWTVTIHRFQPKTGRHQNQSFTLAGDSDELCSTGMVFAFGEVKQTEMYDVVARTHAVTQIQIDSTHAAIHIFTAPTSIRPYVEKLVADPDAERRALEKKMDEHRRALAAYQRLTAPLGVEPSAEVQDIMSELENGTAVDDRKQSAVNNHPMSCTCAECEVL